MSCPQIYADGAYVLGALSPAERATYQGHLAECATCAAAVAALAPMPGLLGRVDATALRPVHTERPEPEPDRLAHLLSAVSALRRRQVRLRRWRLAGASLAAVAATAAGVVVVAAPWQPESAEPPVTATAMVPVVADIPITAQVAVMDAPGGTEIWMSCQYGGWGEQELPNPYWLVAYGTDGTSEQVGSWLVAPGDDITLTGRTRYTYDELDRLELMGSGGITLLTHRP